MKKVIIDVLDGCEMIQFLKETDFFPEPNAKPFKCFVPIGRTLSIDDLPEYAETLTADGLTLKEFFEKANEDFSNVEYHLCTNEPWTEPRDIKNWIKQGKLKEIVSYFTNGTSLRFYRIKPEVVHYSINGNIKNCYCHSLGKWTNNREQVTCPDCIEAWTNKLLDAMEINNPRYVSKDQFDKIMKEFCNKPISVTPEIERINKLNL